MPAYLFAFGHYLQFLATSVALLLAAVTVYVMVTPYNEITLIRNGCRAAAVGLSGTIVGLALPIYSVSSQSWSVAELAGWSAVALLTQLIAFFIVALVVGWAKMREAITGDSLAHGVVLAGFSVAVGLLNAAALVA